MRALRQREGNKCALWEGGRREGGRRGNGSTPFSTFAKVIETRRGATPRGYTLTELLAAAGFIGLVIALVVYSKQEQEQDRQPSHTVSTTARKDGVLVPWHLLRLGDEFVCTVRVIRQNVLDAPRAPEYSTFVRIAQHCEDECEGFLLEISQNERTSGDVSTRCESWDLLTVQTARMRWRENLLSELETAATSEEKLHVIEELEGGPQAVAIGYLDEALYSVVPQRLCESEENASALLVSVLSSDLEHLHEHTHFPLARLAAAIRASADSGGWEPGNLPALLDQCDTAEGPLSPQQQRAIVRALVYRLLDHLPHEVSSESPSLRTPHGR